MSETQLPSNWLWRLLGVAALLLCVIAYEPADGGPWQRLVLPLLMAAAAAFIVQSLLAVVLAGTLLAGIHGNWGQLGSGPWIDSIAFPVLTLACLLTSSIIIWRRFRTRMADTHEARWHQRQARRSAKQVAVPSAATDSSTSDSK